MLRTRGFYGVTGVTAVSANSFLSISTETFMGLSQSRTMFLVVVSHIFATFFSTDNVPKVSVGVLLRNSKPGNVATELPCIQNLTFSVSCVVLIYQKLI